LIAIGNVQFVTIVAIPILVVIVYYSRHVVFDLKISNLKAKKNSFKILLAIDIDKPKNENIVKFTYP